MGLSDKRRANVRSALEKVIERAGEVEVNAAAVVSAVAAYAKIRCWWRMGRSHDTTGASKNRSVNQSLGGYSETRSPSPVASWPLPSYKQNSPPGTLDQASINVTNQRLFQQLKRKPRAGVRGDLLTNLMSSACDFERLLTCRDSVEAFRLLLHLFGARLSASYLLQSPAKFFRGLM
jgi:hypothetical protein